MKFFSRMRSCAGLAMMAVTLLATPALATTVDITINKVSQKMTVMIDGDKEYVWPVSTGARGYDTPNGKYRPFRMEKEHFSKEWDDAPMPNSMFFTGRGHAIHGSYHVKSLGRRASHGCVRLAPDNAAKLFSIVSKAGTKNTTITVKGGFFDFDGNPEREVAKVKKAIKPFWTSVKAKAKPPVKKKKKKPFVLFGALE